MDGAFGRFDDLIAGRGLVFPEAEQLVIARTAQEVGPVLQRVSDATARGSWAFGYVGYDAAPGLDPHLAVVPAAAGDPPPAWFALCGAPVEGPPIVAPPIGAVGSLSIGAFLADQVGSAWRQAWRDDDYDAAIERVRGHIAAGDTYQVNLTSRLLGRVADPMACYASLAHQQHGAHAAYLDLGTHVIASASPELFFSWDGRWIITRPMKGTARRGRTTGEDDAVRAHVRSDPKERAEHVIVVDLLRNDLGRIAEPGSVTVPALGRAERYESVWQLTTDVVGHTRREVGLLDIFRALFPSGSVTGAPKRRTMELIAALEPAARGVYCGAIGYVSPPGSSAPRAHFSVGIRTAVIDAPTGAAVFGVGGGITIGSEPKAERAELQAKSAVLARHVEFSLIETLFCSPTAGLRNSAAHLERLADSADYFGFTLRLAEVVAALESAREHATVDTRLRLTLHRDGGVRVETQPLQPVSGPVTLGIDTVAVDASQRWLFHKTTRRSVYEQAAARHPAANDVVLVNELGRVTETTVANLAVRLDGRWWTPPIEAGCLPGVERARLLDCGRLEVRDLSVGDVASAQSLAVLSSLRGWRRAVLL